MDYPTIVYRVPGPFPGNGFTYDTLGVYDVDAHGVAREGGWHDSIPLAVAAWQAPKAASAPPVAVPELPAADLVSPPTRAEIEAKAKELGITVHHKNTDETLLKKIEEALAPKAEAPDGVDQA
jgi:hypothetical protein